MKIKEVGEEKDRDRRSNRGGGKERNGRGGRDGGRGRGRRVDGRGGSWLINIQNSRTRGLGFGAQSPAVAAQDPQDSRRFEVVKTSRFAVHKVDARGIGTSRICLKDSEDSRCGIQALGGTGKASIRDSRLTTRGSGPRDWPIDPRQNLFLVCAFWGFSLSLSLSLHFCSLSLIFFLFQVAVSLYSVCLSCLYRMFIFLSLFRLSHFVVCCVCVCVCVCSLVCVYLSST